VATVKKVKCINAILAKGLIAGMVYSVKLEGENTYTLFELEGPHSKQRFEVVEETGEVLLLPAPEVDPEPATTEAARAEPQTDPEATAPLGLKARAKVMSTGGSTAYYELPSHATELRHLISHKQMNFNVGNIFKAAYRLGEKQGIDHRYDLNKIITMAQFELEELDRAEGKLNAE